MKIKLLSAIILIAGFSCEQKNATEKDSSPILGTWKLVSSKVIMGKDTTLTFPIQNQEMIKIFNEDTFAFFKHDTNGAKGDSAVFDAGSGTYKLNGQDYSEHLEYCNYRGWENRDFSFKLRLSNDTLIQTGIEKIDSLNINQEIVEIYVRR
ncbi:lipocalin family protein [Dyadobacter sp. CY345]|uniref:lipocalin family protein n=1 Tax=Dyadobacter sp. CY345 TaxID=2909335 RepID=UPI001F1BFA61|nr:lipocalin family protein [Dyadobacter sp. CY345]MCF2446812.1 lipocalin family protein [Dyadobacter sp. CY345]